MDATPPNTAEQPDAQPFHPTDGEGGLILATHLPGSAEEFDQRIGWDGLDRLGADGRTAWIHLDRTKPRAMSWISERSGLEQIVGDALLADETRPRVKEAGDGLLVILRGVNLNPGAEPDDMIAIRVWIEQRRVITLRHYRFQTIVDLRRRAQSGTAPATPAGMLVAIAAGLAMRLGPVVENLQTLLDDAEDQLIGENPDAVSMRALADVRRQAISLRRYLAPQRDVLASLVLSQNPLLDSKSRTQFHEISDQTARVVEDLEELRDRAAVAQEELRAHREARSSRTTYLLTLIAAVFLPLGFLTGLLGINVGGMPGASSNVAFWIVTAMMVLIAVGLVVLFKRLRWL